jgi:hypothetical protein
MKRLRIFTLVSCFVMALYFLIFSFSEISMAEQTNKEKCINGCNNKQQICFNVNVDRRLCNVEFQNCVDACKSESDSPSSTEPTKQQESNPNEQLK